MKDGYTPGTHLMKFLVPALLLAGAVFFGAVEKDETGAIVCLMAAGTLACSQVENVDGNEDWRKIQDDYGLH